MKLLKKIIVIITTVSLLTCLTACADFSSKAQKNIDSYMKTVKNLTVENYISWVSDNLGNPYSSTGLDLSQLNAGQLEYYTNCLSKFEYQLNSIDKENKIAEVKVTYVDSTEYLTNVLTQLFTYIFSPDYTEEGASKIYTDCMNQITEYKFVDDVVYFSLNDDGSINTASTSMFDVVTAGIYKLLIGDPSETPGGDYDKEELLANVDINYEVLNEDRIIVSFKNNNEISVYPIVNFMFADKDGNVVAQSQASIDILPPGETSYTYAYNELNDDIVSFDVEKEIRYYNPEDVTIYDSKSVTCEYVVNGDEVVITFTNNLNDIVDISGGYVVYGENDNIIYVDSINVYDLNPGESYDAWFYLMSNYDEKTDTWIAVPMTNIVFYPIVHSQTLSITAY